VRARRGFFVGVIAYSWVIMRGERTHFISVDPPTVVRYPTLLYHGRVIQRNAPGIRSGGSTNAQAAQRVAAIVAGPKKEI